MQYLALVLEIAHALQTYGPDLAKEIQKILDILKSGGKVSVESRPEEPCS
jgi:hypothetical protein